MSDSLRASMPHRNPAVWSIVITLATALIVVAAKFSALDESARNLQQNLTEVKLELRQLQNERSAQARLEERMSGIQVQLVGLQDEVRAVRVQLSQKR